jgi:hypothetical protein
MIIVKHNGVGIHQPRQLGDVGRDPPRLIILQLSPDFAMQPVTVL